VWVSESADAAGQRDSITAVPARQPPPESRIDFGGSTPATGGDDEPAPRSSSGGELAALEAAISAILDAADPAALAGRIPRSVGTSLAGDCAKAAQRLARLGQVLRSLAA
jgi:hypothetical protein